MKQSLCILVLVAGATLVTAQTPQAPPRRPGAMSMDLATQVTQGWAFLAQGLYEDARAQADAALRVDALNVSALALLIEVEVAGGGAMRALDAYEQWMGSRSAEAPYVLRRVARAILWDAARSSTSMTRADALSALVADGDAEAAVELSTGLAAGQPVDVMTMAKLGSEEAVRRVIADLATNPPNTLALTRALAASKRPEAVEPLIRLLADQRNDVRAEAAAGLGTLGNRAALKPLQGLLSDVFPLVKMNAAASLALLDDHSGATVLREFEDSEHDSLRLGAAMALAVRPDANWQGRLRQLVDSADPIVGINAAVLLAPHDPEAARAGLERHRGASNPAVVEAAERALASDVATNMATLRAFMRSRDSSISVRAAARVLRLVR